MKPANGQRQEETLTLIEATNLAATDWSRDGKWIAYHQNAPTTDVWLLPMEGERKARPFLNTSANELGARFSPNSKYLAYVSDESGQFQVYVQPVPANGSKWQVSKEGGGVPQWRQDGAEMYFQTRDGKLMAVPVSTGPVFEYGTPQTLFDKLTPAQTAGEGSYTAASDGKQFLVVAPATGSAGEAPPLTVITHWRLGLKK